LWVSLDLLVQVLESEVFPHDLRVLVEDIGERISGLPLGVGIWALLSQPNNHWVWGVSSGGGGLSVSIDFLVLVCLVRGGALLSEVNVGLVSMINSGKVLQLIEVGEGSWVLLGQLNNNWVIKIIIGEVLQGVLGKEWV